MILPIIFIFAAYGGASYAGLMLKGWNVTINEWFNPLAGFSWANDPKCIPDSQVFPGGPGAACGGNASSPGGGCNTTDLAKILITPLGEVKLAECLAGKSTDEIRNIIKDLGGGVGAALPGPAGEIVPGVSTIVSWIKSWF